MKMLVVGNPRGEGYRALTRMFQPVRYREQGHTRAALLADRERFHDFAALVVGPDVGPRELRRHPLLHSFYGSGKWVVAAPATTAAQAALRTLHGYSPGRRSAALAVRATGAPGGHDIVRPTIAYPAPTTVRASPRSRSPASKRGRAASSDRRRAAWFRERLVEHGRAHIRPADPRDRRLQSASAAAGISFHLPITAAAIEIQIPFYYEFTLTGSATTEWYRNYDLCGHNPHTHDSWCRETWSGKWGESQSAGQSYSPTTTAWSRVRPSGRGVSSSPAVRTTPGPADQAKRRHVELQAVPGQARGPHRVHADREPPGHGLLLRPLRPRGEAAHHNPLADPTINASIATGAKLAAENAVNGTYEEWWDNDWINTDRQLKETMLFLGAYDHETEIAGGSQLDDNTAISPGPSFVLSGNQSFPVNEITFTSKSEATSKSTSFSVGVFGDMATGGYDHSESVSTSTSVLVPSWKITPVAGKRKIAYQWQTNDPLPWQTILDNDRSLLAPKPPSRTTWALNDLNRVNFIPTSLTVWSGSQTYGPLSITSTRRLKLVDHFSYYDPTIRNGGPVAGPADAFWITTLEYSASPDAATSSDPKAVGPGMNLCDPQVGSPAYVGKDKAGNPLICSQLNPSH